MSSNQGDAVCMCAHLKTNGEGGERLLKISLMITFKNGKKLIGEHYLTLLLKGQSAEDAK